MRKQIATEINIAQIEPEEPELSTLGSIASSCAAVGRSGGVLARRKVSRAGHMARMSEGEGEGENGVREIGQGEREVRDTVSGLGEVGLRRIGEGGCMRRRRWLRRGGVYLGPSAQQTACCAADQSRRLR